jgi:Glycine zipper 2TM domain
MQEQQMEATIKSPNRIHPLMAAAAVSVIIVSLAGAAAITGLLPSSKGAPDTAQQASAAPAANGYATPAAAATVAGYGAAPAAGYGPAPAAYAAPAMAAQYPAQAAAPASPAMVPAMYAQPAPATEKPAPAVRKTVHHKPVHHYTQSARYDGPTYAERPAPAAPRQPNYLAIGTGAVVGGLLGNQIGSGNGRKLATVAGIIGGGMVGNEIAERNR